MPARLLLRTHRQILALAFFIACSVALGGCHKKGSSSGSPTTGHGFPSHDSAATWSASVTCGGGSGSAGGTQTAIENQMIAAIRQYRAGLGLSALNGAVSASAIGVAQWFADDMNTHDYVGLVGSDGEDFLHRFACSRGGTSPINGGVIAVGQSDNIADVLAFLEGEPNANAVLTLSGGGNTRLAVGYSNGYWMIIIY
jgi:hypothetical protein